MTKILHVLSALDAGGVENLLYTYYTNMDQANFKFDIAVTCGNSKPGTFYSKFKDLGCHIYILPKKKNLIKYYFKLKAILKNIKYDIVHVHQDEVSFISLLCAKKRKVKVRIAHAHHTILSKKLTTKIYKKLTNRYCTSRFACSNEAGKSLFYNDSFFIMKNAINIDGFLFNEKERKTLRNLYQIENKKVVGTVARVVDQKNPIFALDVIRQALLIEPNICYCWIGDGEMMQQSKLYIINNNMVNNVKFLGAKDITNRYYNMFDLFFLPSKEEGLGISAVEAQYNGLNCIISNKFPKEVEFTKNKVSFLDLQDDAQKWAEFMIDKLKNNSQDRKIIDNQILNCYFINKYAKILEEKYKELINERNNFSRR